MKNTARLSSQRHGEDGYVMLRHVTTTARVTASGNATAVQGRNARI